MRYYYGIVLLVAVLRSLPEKSGKAELTVTAADGMMQLQALMRLACFPRRDAEFTEDFSAQFFSCCYRQQIVKLLNK